uniref:Uncharacterized protein n=1 Tax=uncultured prokaryote TaxID=198431 RepID=A0A0H5PZ46_9ZZZZ|nr:hypothetical protein [uncultured prokaryote]
MYQDKATRETLVTLSFVYRPNIPALSPLPAVPRGYLLYIFGLDHVSFLRSLRA